MKIYIAQVITNIGVYSKCFKFECDAQAHLEKLNDDATNNGEIISSSMVLLDEIEDYYPCIVASIGDFEEYDLSSLTEEEKKNLAEDVADAMSDNSLAMDCYWDEVHYIAEENGLHRLDDDVFQICNKECNDMPDGLYSFDVFETKEDANEYMKEHKINKTKFSIEKYKLKDIEGARFVEL